MKNILLSVTGLSPQVITETLYALHQNSRNVHAIHVITTREGKERIYANLLAGKSGYYYQYLEDYGFSSSEIDFSHDNIHVIRDEYGIETKDIETEEDNANLLKICLDLAFRFTGDPRTSVFFSVAGGRKTMSSCLTLAAQMYGRPQDRLYHVLVSPEFENNPDFFYPPRVSKQIELKDQNGQPYFKDTRYAQITLIPIPFFSIRDHLSPKFLKEAKDPGTLMLSLIREEPPRLTVNLLTRKIIYKNLELDLMPAHLAVYAFFILQKKNCRKQTENCSYCTDCFVDIQSIFDRQEQITEIYKKFALSRPLDEMSDSGIINLNPENFNSYKSKIRKQLMTRFGPYALKDLEIASAGTRPNTVYGILLDKGKIEIVY